MIKNMEKIVKTVKKLFFLRKHWIQFSVSCPTLAKPWTNGLVKIATL